MKRFFTVLGLVAAFALQAEAKVYEQFKVECDLNGTEQTLWTTQRQLPNFLRLKVEFAKETGSYHADVVRTSVFTMNGDPVAFENGGIAFKPYASEYCRTVGGFNHRVSFESMSLSPAFARELLLLMGAVDVPDLSILYPKGVVELGSVSVANASCSAQLSFGPIGQIHFEKDFRDGLSYHLVLTTCQVTYRSPGGIVLSTGQIGQIGPKPAPAPAPAPRPVPGRKGD